MRIFFTILLAAHGLIHLMGFAKGFGLATLSQLKVPVSRGTGLLWLAAAVLYTATGFLFGLSSDSWWVPCIPALVLSQALIVLSWRDAKFGTAANLIVLVPLVVAVMNALPSSFRNTYRREVEHSLLRTASPPTVREEDLARLPVIVREYLRGAGVIGKSVPRNVRASLEGEMRLDFGGKWVDIRADQYDFFDAPERMFSISSSMFGIPIDGLHIYRRGSATMRIKAASLFQVVDAKGPEMNQGETVTLFNDMCLLAPATLVSDSIQWDSLAPLVVRAKFSTSGITIRAELYFNRQGELIGFHSEDRYQSTDGSVYNKYGWSTPVGQYSDFRGVRVASYGEAIWHTPRGDFPYARFRVRELEYDCPGFR